MGPAQVLDVPVGGDPGARGHEAQAEVVGRDAFVQGAYAVEVLRAQGADRGDAAVGQQDVRGGDRPGVAARGGRDRCRLHRHLMGRTARPAWPPSLRRCQGRTALCIAVVRPCASGLGLMRLGGAGSEAEGRRR